jgi:hypothetical protein
MDLQKSLISTVLYTKFHRSWAIKVQVKYAGTDVSNVKSVNHGVFCIFQKVWLNDLSFESSFGRTLVGEIRTCMLDILVTSSLLERAANFGEMNPES